jgi:hypothetical protein
MYLYFRLTCDWVDLSAKNSAIETAGYSNYPQIFVFLMICVVYLIRRVVRATFAHIPACIIQMAKQPKHLNTSTFSTANR